MPKSIYESLSTWGLSECREEILLTDNTIILPIGVAEGIFTTIMGRMVSTDYLVIDCAGTGQITLGRSLLKLMGAIIDFGKGTVKFTSPPCSCHVFSRGKKKKGKKNRRKAPGLVDASSLDNHRGSELRHRGRSTPHSCSAGGVRGLSTASRLIH
jgi:hypothetical protein